MNDETLTPEEVNTILAFLERTSLAPSEINPFLHVRAKLVDLRDKAQPPKKPA